MRASLAGDASARTRAAQERNGQGQNGQEQGRRGPVDPGPRLRAPGAEGPFPSLDPSAAWYCDARRHEGKRTWGRAIASAQRDQ
jgi:hypothetical protein